MFRRRFASFYATFAFVLPVTAPAHTTSRLAYVALRRGRRPPRPAASALVHPLHVVHERRDVGEVFAAPRTRLPPPPDPVTLARVAAPCTWCADSACAMSAAMCGKLLPHTSHTSLAAAVAALLSAGALALAAAALRI